VLNDPGCYCLSHILAFVPDDSFRFVAPVSHIFRGQYLATHHNSTRTLWLHAAATPRTVQLWLDDGRPVLPLAVMAARRGRLDVLIYLHDGGWRPLNPDVDGRNILRAAAPYGHFHVWDWALTNEVAVWDVNAALHAAIDGNLDVLRFARDRGYPMSGREYGMSAAHGHLNVVMWLHEQDYPWEADTCSYAAGEGHLHILQWLRANDCPWDAETCASAAENGHLHVLQWARANGCDWDEMTCTRAAAFGHLHILQWARANDCPWDESVCFNAAEIGYLDILQWARANGCPWDAAACLQAARDEDHVEIVQWIITTGNII
jgi:hypothetical protein